MKLDRLGAAAVHDVERGSPLPAALPATFAGWGRRPIVEGRRIESEDFEAITKCARLSRGLGRSYGDAALPAQPVDIVAVSTRADRLLAFNSQSGLIRAESGLSLRELNRLFLPRGWFPPVSPGTEYVTLGGMVAADVHGKNHHVAGSFGRHVTSLKMRVADGRVLECARDKHADLFRATLGGMGLTGHILDVEFRMERIPSPWICCESRRVGNFGELLGELSAASAQWPFTVAWSDWSTHGKAMGRGIVIKGRWATESGVPGHRPGALSRRGGEGDVRMHLDLKGNPTRKRPRRLPWGVTSWLIRPAMLRAFSAMYYGRHVSVESRTIVSPFSFFYPLDAVSDWNLAYGRSGFTQYQCVLPAGDSQNAAIRLMEIVRAAKATVALCVIKDFGAEGEGGISFPRPGLTIALDLPVYEVQTEKLVDRLNEEVIEDGGRVYLAKDAYTRREHFQAMEPRLADWTSVRRRWDPDGLIRSAQSVRLFGDAA